MATGKWTDPSVPHSGWTCTLVEDLGQPDETCQMCEVQEIRYVHTMEHPDYPDPLHVGCICAGNMEQDYAAAAEREKRLRDLARRRASWAKRRWWRQYANYPDIHPTGEEYLRTEGFELRICQPSAHANAWRIIVTHRASRRRAQGKQQYPSPTAAKAAALNALLWAKEKLATP